MIVDGLLQRDSAARLVQFAAHGNGTTGGMMTLGGLIDELVRSTWRDAAAPSAKLAALQRVAQRAVADRLLGLAADSDAAREVRAMAELKLVELRPSAMAWSKSAARSEEERAHWLAIAADLGQWIDKRQLPNLTRALVAPPGDPF